MASVEFRYVGFLAASQPIAVITCQSPVALKSPLVQAGILPYPYSAGTASGYLGSAFDIKRAHSIKSQPAASIESHEIKSFQSHSLPSHTYIFSS